MSYFNPVTRLAETVSVTRVEKDAKGQSTEVQREVVLHRCMGIVPEAGGARCRLVHEGFTLAKDCARRDHQSHWVQTYTRVDGTVDSYKRRAVRRDGPIPVRVSQEVPAQAPTPAPPAPVPSLEEVRAFALSYGMRLSRIPVKPAPQVLDQDLEELEDLE